MRSVAVAGLAALLLGLVSCGSRELGWGVLTWNRTAESIPSGEVVRILEQSSISDTYRIEYENSQFTVARKWVRMFESREEAVRYSDQLDTFRSIFAVSNQNALPVRARMDRASHRLYRLRAGEIMKVLEQSESMQSEGGLVAYWYRVLTEDGTDGWVFGHHLSVFDEAEGPPATSGDDMDEVIGEFLLNTWRPAAFHRMITTGRYDLSIFSPVYGLFPEPERNVLRISLPSGEHEFAYSDIYRISQGRYGLEGVPVELEFPASGRVTVRYPVNGRDSSSEFVVIEEDIRELSMEEQNRRLDLFVDFFEAGELYRSTAYGRITLSRDRRFSWTGYSRLVPTVVPEATQGSGTLEFDTYLSGDLLQLYDGVVTFQFSRTGVPVPVRFLYRFTPDGLQLTYLPEELREGVTVEQEPVSPFVLFFRAN